jgi:hypothetical protein
LLKQSALNTPQKNHPFDADVAATASSHHELPIQAK